MPCDCGIHCRACVTQANEVEKLHSMLLRARVSKPKPHVAQVLYDLLALPYLPGSRLLLVGIANSIDLTERTLSRLPAKVGHPPNRASNCQTVTSQSAVPWHMLHGPTASQCHGGLSLPFGQGLVLASTML